MRLKKTHFNMAYGWRNQKKKEEGAYQNLLFRRVIINADRKLENSNRTATYKCSCRQDIRLVGYNHFIFLSNFLYYKTDWNELDKVYLFCMVNKSN